MGSPAPQLPVSPNDAFDMEPAEQMAEVIRLGEYKNVPDFVEQPEVALPFILGSEVTIRLLEWPAWDHFWIGVGKHFSGIYDAAASIFGKADQVTHEEMRLAINLGQHIQARALRQVSAQWAGRYNALGNMVIKSSRGLANRLNHEVNRLTNYEKAVDHRFKATVGDVERYARKLRDDLRDQQNQARADAISGLRQWVVDTVYRPLRTNIGTVSQRLGDFQHAVLTQYLPDIEREMDSRFAAQAAALGTVAAAVARLTKESQECQEPMCETMGPKTDWGKFFKRFSPALFLALLALWEKEDPEAVEHAAERLADVLGPVLEEWTTSWLGIAQGSTQAAETAVQREAGHVPGL